MKLKFEYRIVKEVDIKKDEFGVEDLVTEFHLRNVLFKNGKPSKIVDSELFLFSQEDSESAAIDEIATVLESMQQAYNKPILDRQELQL